MPSTAPALTAQQVQALTEAGEIDAAQAAARQALPALAGAERGAMLLALSSACTVAGDALETLRNGVAAREAYQALAATAGPGLAAAQAGVCDALSRVAGALRLAGDHATAINTLEQAESLAREAGLPLHRALVLRQIGVGCSLVGHHHHARNCLDEAEALAAAHGSTADRLLTRLSSLNARNRFSGSLPAGSDERRQTLADSLQDWAELARSCEQAGLQRLAVMAQGNHAITLAELGHHDRALAELRALEPRYRSLGMRPNEGLCLSKMAWSQQALGDAAGACDSATRAVAVLREGGALDRRKSDEQARAAVAQRELRIELARLSSQWAQQARTDPLTGLGNRRALDHWMAERLPRVERGSPLCVLLMDLDHFKWVNDRHGHAMGDEVLRRVARELQRSCRGEDLAVRYGGEEFVLAMAGAELEAAAAAAERLRAAVAALPWQALADGLEVSLSIGVAAAMEGAGAPELFALADRRLYLAKFSGRDRVVSAG